MDPGADLADRVRQMVRRVSNGLDMGFRLTRGNGNGHRLLVRFLGGQGQHIRGAAQIAGRGRDASDDIANLVLEGFGQTAECVGSLVLAASR